MIKIMHLYSAFFICICSNVLYTYCIFTTHKGQTTTPGASCPTLRIVCGSLKFPAMGLRIQETGPTVYLPLSRRLFEKSVSAELNEEVLPA